ILRGVRQQQDEPGRFSICSRQAAVVRLPHHQSAVPEINSKAFSKRRPLMFAPSPCGRGLG
ncbi:hypothetical protein C5X90_024700, partial [Klebsiella pneumoniae subsp. pneumoniae]